MLGSGYFVRLAATLVAAALLGAVIMKPEAGRRVVDKAAAFQLDPNGRADRACALGEQPLTGPFAPIEDVLSVSPLGAVTAPGEPLPTPYIRINTRQGATAFERRQTSALAPARAEIVALERRVIRNAAGAAIAENWTVHFKPCEKITITYDNLDSIDSDILRRAGGLSSFMEIDSADHLARATGIRINAGEIIGAGDGFDVSLQDLSATPTVMARPERYSSNPYEEAVVFDAPPALLAAIATDHTRARCALDYLPRDLKAAWTQKLGDAWGMRRAKGDNACRTALVDKPGAAQGAWFTDASHNALTNKVSAVALAPDAVDPERLIFALHGRLKSLSPDMIGLAPMLEEQRLAASRDFLTFERGDGRINAPFEKVKEGETYCYERLRANFVGPKINGVVLLGLSTAENGAALMKVEARGDVSSCLDLEEPWSFTGNETTFYR